jgi:hypothetical protein
MKTRSAFVMLFLAGFFLMGCEGWPGELSKQGQALVGQWVNYQGPITTRYEFKADRTCTRLVTVAMPGNNISEPDEGTWWMAEDSTLWLSLKKGQDTVKESYGIKVMEGALEMKGLQSLTFQHPK